MRCVANPSALDEWIAAWRASAAAGTWRDAVLSKVRRCAPAADAEPLDLERITLRPARVRDAARVLLVHRHATRDLTRHADLDAAERALRDWLRPDGGSADGVSFAHATLHRADGELQLLTSRKGVQRLVRHRGAPSASPVAETSETTETAGTQAHDRAKPRHVPRDAPWLRALGVVDAQGRLVPAMARKWKQIDRFVALLDAAWRRSPLAGRDTVRVVDFGCGKGYLTFALHDHLRRRGIAAEVIGVDLKADVVAESNRIARQLGLDGLAFVEGDLRSVEAGAMDVTIALHACDTATDHALALGLAAGAALLVVSPCCHKELRPQLADPPALAPLLRHGVHRGQQAEMLTDTLRTLALEEAGYDAGVMEFVALEHTNKNKLIVATRKAGDDTDARERAAGEVDAIKTFWGIREQALARIVRERAGMRLERGRDPSLRSG